MTRYLLIATTLLTSSLACAQSVPDDGVLSLEGVKHVDLDCPALRITGTPITIQTWLKTTSGGIVFACGWENRAPGPQGGYMLYFAGGGRIRFGVNNGAHTWSHDLWDDLTTEASYSDGKWHQLTSVFPGDGKTRVKLYVDGVEVTTSVRAGVAQLPLNAYTVTDPPARIGMRNDPVEFRKSGNYTWAVQLDEMRIWNIALTDKDVKANWKTAVDPRTPGLVAYWKFNEKSREIGDIVRDSAGNNHGVVAKYEYKPPYAHPLLPVDPVAFPEDDFDYGKYPEEITGYNGQDRQRIAFLSFRKAERRRIGVRGNYKAGFTVRADGAYVVATCRDETHPTKPDKTAFQIYVYESTDEGRTWTEIARPGIVGKEPCLDLLPDGTLFLITQEADFTKPVRTLFVARSADGGQSWDFEHIEGISYPRRVVVEPDGTILFAAHDGGWNLKLARSTDAGRTWTFSRGQINWGNAVAGTFDEVALTRLSDGVLLAAFRRCIPGYHSEGFEHSMLTRSTDNGETWSEPLQIGDIAEVHYQIIELPDGRLLAVNSNYHLPYGARARLSSDRGKTWDNDHPIQLAVSADIHTAWPVTRLMPDGDLITVYAIELYSKKEEEPTTATEILRWRLPEKGELP